jgi:hypothetical protein
MVTCWVMLKLKFVFDILSSHVYFTSANFWPLKPRYPTHTVSIQNTSTLTSTLKPLNHTHYHQKAILMVCCLLYIFCHCLKVVRL